MLQCEGIWASPKQNKLELSLLTGLTSLKMAQDFQGIQPFPQSSNKEKTCHPQNVPHPREECGGEEVKIRGTIESKA